MIISHKKQFGAVSLFLVIFATLILLVITIGFVRLMISDQQQATTYDLSQSAYDSAQAGVEDAKRAIARMTDICDASPASAACATAKSNLNSTTCNAAVSGLSGVTTSGGEVKIQTNTSDSKLQQAYTCLQVNLTPPDYLGTLSDNESMIIPLKATNNFTQIKLEWFTSHDMSSSFGSSVSLSSSGVLLLPQYSPTNSNSWPANRPPIIRAQLIQFDKGGFALSDFDRNNDSSTLFLYPRTISSVSTSQSNKYFSNNIRMTLATSTNNIQPTPVRCKSSLAGGGYACSAVLYLPSPYGGSSSTREAYLRLTAIYNKANFRVSYNSSSIKFNGVQPEVDSTGRANKVYERVKSRVEASNINFPYPEAAVDITNSFCKDFWVTDDSSEYNSNANGSETCTP